MTFIGCTTFILSAIGVKVGNVFGMKYKSKAEFVGGLILVLMGIKILLEHLGFLWLSLKSAAGSRKTAAGEDRNR